MPTLPLKDIPEEVKDYILEVQSKIKRERKLSQFSQQATIFHIIREHKKLTEKK